MKHSVYSYAIISITDTESVGCAFSEPSKYGAVVKRSGCGSRQTGSEYWFCFLIICLGQLSHPSEIRCEAFKWNDMWGTWHKMNNCSMRVSMPMIIIGHHIEAWGREGGMSATQKIKGWVWKAQMTKVFGDFECALRREVLGRGLDYRTVWCTKTWYELADVTS